MQKCLFNIPDSGRLPTSVMTFINKLGTNKQEPAKDVENVCLQNYVVLDKSQINVIIIFNII